MVWNCTCDCGGAVQLDTRTLQRGTVRDCGCETKVKGGQKDLTGQRFGRLVCLEPSPHRNKQGGTQWLCQCDCGKQCLAATHQLLCGYKKSCGCLSHPPLKDYVGKRFGMLTVLEYAGKWDRMHRWRCLCDCGNETIVGQTLLQSGRTKSCGCSGSPPMEDLTGRIFGKLTVLELAEWKNGTSYWHCRCECGNETIVRYVYLINGHSMDRTRYFFVEKFYQTDFKKVTPRVPMGSRMFDLSQVLGVKTLPDTEAIAQALQNKEWM